MCVLAFRLIVAGNDSRVNFMDRSLPVFVFVPKKVGSCVMELINRRSELVSAASVIES
jgi:hypothetical protein